MFLTIIYRYISILCITVCWKLFTGLLERASSRISKSRFNAFERRRSTIPAGQKKMHIPKSHDVYDDANDLRGSSHNYISYPQPRPSNSTEQFQYDNPGFKDEKL